MARAKLKLVSASLPPERQALAEAIDAHRAAQAEVAAIQAAIERAQDAWRDARRRRDAAEAAIDGAKAAAAEHAIQAALGKAGRPPLSPAKARQALAEAQEALETTEATVAALNDRLTQAQLNAHLSRDRMGNAVRTVMKTAPETVALAARVERLQRELADAGSALQWLYEQRSVDATPVDVSPNIRESAPAVKAVMRFQSPCTSWNELLTAVPGPAPWAGAMADLANDATTELPK